MGKKCFLVLGGARSGKSCFAEEVASQLGDRVLFVATGEALDEEMRLRIEEHGQSRLLGWLEPLRQSPILSPRPGSVPPFVHGLFLFFSSSAATALTGAAAGTGLATIEHALLLVASADN